MAFSERPSWLQVGPLLGADTGQEVAKTPVTMLVCPPLAQDGFKTLPEPSAL